MQVQWFPGHMAKTRRIIQEQLKLVDVIIELVDARIPKSSRNPLISQITEGKPRVIILNKDDLADERVTSQWLSFYNDKESYKGYKMNSTTYRGSIINSLKEGLLELTQEKREQRLAKGIRKQAVRTMVVGIPNVGKSTFINNIVGKKTAKTGNKPGVTKGKQWIRLDKDIELLDIPGILWPKFEDPEVGFKLAVTGAVSDDVFDLGEASLQLISFLVAQYPKPFAERYKLSFLQKTMSPLEILEEMAINRGCLLPGRNVDYLKIATIFLNEFRSGKIGRISMEKP